MAVLQQNQSAYAHQHPSLISPSDMQQPPTPRTDSFANGDALHRHLLVETAMFDSSRFDILAIEEVDALKKEKTKVDARIEGTRRKLALESKVREAARSLHRLYLQEGRLSQGRRKSLLGDRRLSSSSVKSNSAGQASEELAQSEKKVEELVQILVGLENRRQYIESRLLCHTAAVLQAAHLQREAEAADHLSPDHLPHIRDYDQSVHSDVSKGQSIIHNSQLNDVNTRLQFLNGQMRSLISQAKKGRAGSIDTSPDDIPSAYPEDDEPSIRLNNQLEQLQDGIFALLEEHKYIAQSREDADQGLVEKRLEGVNNQLFTFLSGYEGIQSPPQPTGQGIQDQISYLEENITNVDHMLQHSASLQDSHQAMTRDLDEAHAKANTHAEKSAQHEAVMLGLWGIMSSKESAAANRDVDFDDEELERTTSEPFSTEAFTSKVQHLFSRHNDLESQTAILKRQIEQQRELAGKSTSEDAARASEIEELKEREQEALEEVEAHSKRIEQLEDQIVELENKISEHQDEARIAAIEAQHKESDHQDRLEELTGSLNQAKVARDTAEANLAIKAEEMDDLEAEIVRLTTEVAMAKAELDGAYGSRSERAKESQMAEMLGLHQNAESRAKALEGEIITLREIQAAGTRDDGRMRALEKELADMATDYQELTRETVEMEKEREKLEGVIDSLRDKMDALEVQLSDEKVRWLGVRSPGGTPELGGTRETTSTMVLRNEFKKMMRETRAEGVKLLRAEQEQRRQIESQLRSLRRERNGGVSPRLGMNSPGLRPT
ncbi:uncharacterized protein M437DRAFT_59606 [Aureobasidium melanogenum CBS 110374]|uniref:Uncharacterized protein n=1 Tax=Aureobasidium melanogenum (strain CBS 110374) TaxID=1043003 RepID=A0A074VDA2_AURM1|nr:uncharacterized protein M437DRAFT_59606 [Aureobasidium melanogenum CBS 110374]KEQ58353.1 hypothetical protein M437DRAFT_59606 [Aureobasidium melanogenum CBS 110374]